MFTVFGATGFVGQHLVAQLEAEDEQVFAPGRDDESIFDRDLGHVIFSIGNNRFATEPFEVVGANVTVLASLLECCRFTSFLYLSSTRLYIDSADASEDSPLTTVPLDPSHLFNITKLAGEALCLAARRPSVRIARLSNVTGVNVGSHNFLPTLVRDAITKGRISLQITPDSSKDYVLVRDAVCVLPRIARAGRHRIYNVASGQNTTARDIVRVIEQLTGCVADWVPSAPVIRPVEINMARLRDEFAFRPTDIMSGLEDLVRDTRKALAEGRRRLADRRTHGERRFERLLDREGRSDEEWWEKLDRRSGTDRRQQPDRRSIAFVS